ncbi:MAG: isoprenylcysteine carboxylmethyltransferase family protein [Theionarchaea archaeon]|nr:isoprenylcysteine carboxylmethyltransferase family protein [Theionarchaea archaeon]MBU7038384.1 isoprenylcysteine carboxylmethyltransferase family protein [Theionarchaea archaeon]
MIDQSLMAGVLTLLVALFFSVHIYMDLRMARSRRNSSSRDREFPIPGWAKALAFPPSLVFWALFLISPLLLYRGWYYQELTFLLFRNPHEDVIQVAGLLVILGGVVLADWGRVSRGVIAPSGPMPSDYTLATRGAYGVMRHPLYMSYWLFFIGLPLALLSVPLLLLLVGIPGYYGIATAEEKILIQKFGEKYRKYQKEVGMFLPKVW